MVDTFEKRLNELEVKMDKREKELSKAVFGWKIVALVLVVLLAGSLIYFNSGYVNAATQDLVVTDSKGAVRIRMGVMQKDEPYFTMYDNRGNSRIFMGVTPKGDPYVYMYNKEAKVFWKAP